MILKVSTNTQSVTHSTVLCPVREFNLLTSSKIISLINVFTLVPSTSSYRVNGSKLSTLEVVKIRLSPSPMVLNRLGTPFSPEVSTLYLLWISWVFLLTPPYFRKKEDTDKTNKTEQKCSRGEWLVQLSCISISRSFSKIH